MIIYTVMFDVSLLDNHLVSGYKLDLGGMSSCDRVGTIEFPLFFRTTTHTFRAPIAGVIPKKDCRYEFAVSVKISFL